jgi:hypothetical protein
MDLLSRSLQVQPNCDAITTVISNRRAEDHRAFRAMRVTFQDRSKPSVQILGTTVTNDRCGDVSEFIKCASMWDLFLALLHWLFSRTLGQPAAGDRYNTSAKSNKREPVRAIKGPLNAGWISNHRTRNR